jgi:hypothetical protein
MVADHLATLRRDAQRPFRSSAGRGAADTSDVVLRLCRVGDDSQLERLAALEGRPVPFGRMVVADVRGRVVAALPLGGGHALADPFVRTAHLMPLLELRAAQLRDPASRRLAPVLGLARLARARL